MADELTLMAVPRTVLGKQVKALRREGLVPGVVYGPAVGKTIQVSVNRRELERFYTAHGHATLFTLTWEGGAQQVFIKEVQVEPVRRAPLHVDFFAPNMMKEIIAGVPVLLTHHNPAAEGVLNVSLSEVQVRALPAAFPRQIDVDVFRLVRSHDTLHARDLAMPAGVTLATDPDAIVASVVPTAQEVAEAPTEAAVPAAAVEEAPAAAEESAES
jgi:large subunit ribosomal protein L25